MRCGVSHCLLYVHVAEAGLVVDALQRPGHGGIGFGMVWLLRRVVRLRFRAYVCKAAV